MTASEKKQLLAQFIVHLRNMGIRFIDNTGSSLGVRVMGEADPIMEIVHEYIGEEDVT